MGSGYDRGHGSRWQRHRTLCPKATVAVFSPAGEVVLVKHNGEDDWTLPGGRVVEGEDPAQRAVTGIAGVTGVHISDPVHVGRYAGTVASHDVYVAEGSGDPRPDLGEAHDAIWWDMVEPLQVHPNVRLVLDIVDTAGAGPDEEDETEVSPAHMQSAPAGDLKASQPEDRVQATPGGRLPAPDTARSRDWSSFPGKAWGPVVTVTLLLADWLIWMMLRTRSTERRNRPTRRVAWPRGLKEELMNRQDNTCVYCGYRRTARTLYIDHMIPAVRGGSNDVGNLQVICRPCIQRKWLQTDQEFRTRYSRLVPPTPLTPPVRRITQNEFREETRLNRQSVGPRGFRRTRYVNPREKVLSGCIISGCVVAGSFSIGLASIGVEGLLLIVPALVLGGAVGIGIGLRAHVTGVTSEVEG